MKIATMNLKAAYCFSCSALSLVILLGACFSDHVTTAGGGPSGAELCAGNQPNVVRVRDFAFEPATLNVPAGTTVTFVNCDTETHTSTSDTNAWDSGSLSPATTFQRTFPSAGTFPYHCDPHPFMKGTVVVS